MPPHPCETCLTSRAQILRPSTGTRLCAPCFTLAFETETASTITSSHLFHPSERIAIGASGGKDSTVLASVLQTLNARYAWGLELVLLSIDEGIAGYRDHSLEAVKRNAEVLGLPLKILGYEELYGWSMDEVVAQVGRKGNCTYCGVFRRQALDRGAAALGVRHVVTGHNADDVAETVVMNLLRGDLARLGRGTSLVTGTGGLEGGFASVKRSKPLMWAYEKEIVMYAHHKRLDYFSTECIYSPEAFRGSARTLIKNLERIRPESILDVVRSGIDMARLVPGAGGEGGSGSRRVEAMSRDVEDDTGGGCSGGNGEDAGGEMARVEETLRLNERAEEEGTETEIRLPAKATHGQRHDRDVVHAGPAATALSPIVNGQNHDRHTHTPKIATVPIRTKQEKKSNRKAASDAAPPRQRLGQCERCGYLSSQAVCKACMLLEGLNKARPRTGIEVGGAALSDLVVDLKVRLRDTLAGLVAAAVRDELQFSLYQLWEVQAGYWTAGLVWRRQQVDLCRKYRALDLDEWCFVTTAKRQDEPVSL
ncbi:cytosolic thiouridylase subunit Ctu1 [Friedmanniomyces endolithicus]|nr:cytosolic thiouridylase subunit Ctu1 [Friedmanniomyces endolithicus]